MEDIVLFSYWCKYDTDREQCTWLVQVVSYEDDVITDANAWVCDRYLRLRTGNKQHHVKRQLELHLWVAWSPLSVNTKGPVWDLPEYCSHWYHAILVHVGCVREYRRLLLSVCWDRSSCISVVYTCVGSGGQLRGRRRNWCECLSMWQILTVANRCLFYK